MLATSIPVFYSEAEEPVPTFIFDHVCWLNTSSRIVLTLREHDCHTVLQCCSASDPAVWLGLNNHSVIFIFIRLIDRNNRPAITDCRNQHGTHCRQGQTQGVLNISPCIVLQQHAALQLIFQIIKIRI